MDIRKKAHFLVLAVVLSYGVLTCCESPSSSDRVKNLFFDVCNDSALSVAAFQYGTSAGWSPLVNMVAGLLANESIDVSSKEVVIVDGFVVAQNILSKLFIDDNSTVVYQNGCLSPEDIERYRYFGARVVGMDFDSVQSIRQLEKLCVLGQIDTKKLKFIQVLSDTVDGHEALSRDVKRDLYNFAKKYDVFLVEDGRYRKSFFEQGDSFGASLKMIDRKGDNSRVIQIRDFSHLMGDNCTIRSGYIVCPLVVAEKVEAVNASTTLHPNAFVQTLVYKRLCDLGCEATLKNKNINVEVPRMPAWVWEKFSAYGKKVEICILRQILKVVQNKDIISLAGGVPDPETFPVKIVKRKMLQLSESDWNCALQPSPVEGLEKLRVVFAKYLTKRFSLSSENALSSDDLIITDGSQNSLDLLGWLAAKLSDLSGGTISRKIITGKPTYLGAMAAMEPYVEDIESNYDLHTMQGLDALEKDLSTRKSGDMPALIYMVPTFGNPDGRVMGTPERERLLQIGRRFNIIVVEDDPYGLLMYDQEPMPDTLYKMSKRKAFRDVTVLYIGTVSKMLMPGLRIGYTVLPQEISQLYKEHRKKAKDGANPIAQTLAAAVVDDADEILEHVARYLIPVYRPKRDVVVKSLRERLSKIDGFCCTEGRGGMFIWVTFPEDINTSELLNQLVNKGVWIPMTKDRYKIIKPELERASREPELNWNKDGSQVMMKIKVAIIPGEHFKGDTNQARIAFVTNPPELLKLGVEAIDAAVAMQR